MTSLYDEKGNNLACTIIEAGPCVVTQIKNEEKDGYNSVQLGFLDKKREILTKLRLDILKMLRQLQKAIF